MPSFSIIIPVKPGCCVAASEHLNKVLPDVSRYEILIAEGSAPSRQRNLAAMEASGEILYFLDDDSLVEPGNLIKCSEAMSDPNVAVVGGPSVTPAEDTWLQRLFGQALASKFGSGAVSNRYRSYGKPRETTDKELILCNLAVRRAVFVGLNGFNECLYPNEENEFMERVAAAGYKLIHEPAMTVSRSQRQTVNAFIRQMFNYGRGRAQQTLLTKSYSLVSFIPLFFIVYLLLALIFIKNVVMLLPLVLYVLGAFMSTVSVAVRSRESAALLLLCVYPLMHVVNGFGLLWGLLNGKPQPPADSHIEIKRIKSF